MAVDDIRPGGTVQVQCSICEWYFWLHCDDPKLPAGPFECPSCYSKRTGKPITKEGEAKAPIN